MKERKKERKTSARNNNNWNASVVLSLAFFFPPSPPVRPFDRSPSASFLCLSLHINHQMLLHTLALSAATIGGDVDVVFMSLLLLKCCCCFMQIQWCVEKEERIINGHDTPPTGKASAPGTSGVCGAIIERNKKPQPPNKFYL
jgi:hypothetical protein